MEQNTLVSIIKDQTDRALWEVKNVIDCIPDELWSKEYCGQPCYKHVYHTLHSLDQWYVNPRVYSEPQMHSENLNNLDADTSVYISREEINAYFASVKSKIDGYIASLDDGQLLKCPENCEYTKFTLILAQFRHLHSHMGMLMGFIIDDTGMWPRVLGLTRPIPDGEYDKYC